MDLIDYFYERKNIKFHNINIVQGILNEVFVNENNYFRYKISSVRRVLLLVNQYPNQDDILTNLLSNIESSRPKNYDFIKFNQAKYYLKKLKDKNTQISNDIDLIISSINKAICNYIKSIFDEDYNQILNYNNFKALTTHVYN